MSQTKSPKFKLSKDKQKGKTLKAEQEELPEGNGEGWSEFEDQKEEKKLFED